MRRLLQQGKKRTKNYLKKGVNIMMGAKKKQVMGMMGGGKKKNVMKKGGKKKNVVKKAKKRGAVKKAWRWHEAKDVIWLPRIPPLLIFLLIALLNVLTLVVVSL